MPNYTEQDKSLLGVFQENLKSGGRKALTRIFPANKATNRPDRQDTRGQVFHVFSHEIQTVSRCIVSLFNCTAPLLQTYVLQQLYKCSLAKSTNVKVRNTVKTFTLQNCRINRSCSKTKISELPPSPQEKSV